MKRNIIPVVMALLLLSLATRTHAQTSSSVPQGINYQAVMRNSIGTIMANKAVTLKLTLHAATTTGTTVYEETYTVTTNTYGLVNVVIGQGSPTSGAYIFNKINWAANTLYMQVQVNPGTGYVDLGTTQLISVPYAMVADTALHVPAGVTYNAGTGIKISNDTVYNTAPDKTVTLTGQSLVSVTGTYPDFTITGNGDGWGSQTVNTNTTLSGAGTTLSPLGIAQQSATIGQVLKWNGTTWVPANDSVGASGSSGSGWSLTGNSGTSPSTNFVGTTDNQPLNFRINNQNAGHIDYTLLNTSLGYQAGNVSYTTGGGNVAFGYQALYSNTTGYQNTGIGINALYSNTTGLENIAIGTGTLSSNTTGNLNTAVGAAALTYNTTGIGNTATGAAALSRNKTGKNNTATGYQTMQYNTTGNNNTAIGEQAFFSNTTGNNNTVTGFNAHITNTTGSYNTVMGSNALYFNVTGNHNVAIGNKALYQYTNSYSTAIGDSALASDTSLGFNTAIGYAALASNTSGVGNTALGNQSLSYNTTGAGNTALGNRTLSINLTGDNNTAIGSEILVNNSTGSYNTGIGTYVLYFSVTGNNNTATGYNALYNNNIGSNNTAYGYGALTTNTIGSNNTAIGCYAGPFTSNLTNATAIGYFAKVNASNSMVLGGTGANAVNVGVGTTTPLESMDLNGAIKVANNGYAITNGATTPVPNGGAGTIVYQSSDNHFYGWNGTTWKQLDN